LIVADAGPLIAFARIERLDLIHQIFGEIVLPDAVYNELVIRGQGQPGAQEIAQSSWIKRQAIDTEPDLVNFASRLHRGELEAISLARNIGAELLIDERQGREVARDYRVEILGSLAVLAGAKRQGLIDLARPVLAAIINAGYWIDADLVTAFLSEIDES